MSTVLEPDILAVFCRQPATCTATSLGSGNINDTFLIESGSGRFVLQRINGDVFPEPLRVIHNFQKVSEHLMHERAAGKLLQVAEPVLTLDGRLYHRDATGSFWRAQTYLPHQSCREVTRPGQVHRIGQVLATFHRLIEDLEVRDILDPLPGFHHLPGYLKEYDRQLERPLSNRAADEDFRFCLAAVERYRQQAATLEKAKEEGILQLQPIHGDPKVDNFVFNNQGEVVGLLDLDTVAMGLVHHDLGDCLRSCCNRAGESGGNSAPVTFDLQFCQALLEGYFSAPAPRLTAVQRSLIFEGVLLICFELGLRFFTDHLCGNVYFRVPRDGDNLIRAVRQFQLADAISRQEQRIRRIALSAG